MRAPSLQRTTVLFAGFVGGLLLAVEAWHEIASYRGEIGRIERTTKNLARSLTQHAEDTLEMADVAIQGIVARFEAEGMADHSLAVMMGIMAKRVAGMPRLASIFVLGPDGQWLVSSSPPARAQANNADRDYFRHHVSYTGDAPFFGTPIQSRATGKWIIPISRRIDRADGSFGGVVVATVEYDYFTKTYKEFQLGRRGAIALFHRNGALLVRSPEVPSTIGTMAAADTSFFKTRLPQASVGTFRYVSPFDKVERISSYVSSPRFPIVVLTALSTDESLALWRSQALTRIAVVIAATLLIFGLGLRMSRDARRRGAAEKALAESEARFRLLAENASDMVTRIGRDGVRRYVSPASKRLLGYAPEELVGRSVYDTIDGADREAVRRAIIPLVAGEAEETTVTFQTTRRDGKRIWVEAALRVARDPGTDAPDGVVAVSRDVSERKRLEAQLHSLASTDGLTGLANRRAFDERLRAEWVRAARARGGLSVLLIDVDHFKAFNDHFGHQEGDRCLRLVARAAAQAAFRPGDFAARYGGEEIAIILPETDEIGAIAVAERARRTVEQLDLTREDRAPFRRITVSIGCASMFPSDAQGGTQHEWELVCAADRALYRAKAAGRNRVVLATDPTRTGLPTAAAG